MIMRTMYDSVRPEAIPRNAQVVAGYVDGAYAWTGAEWGLFPNAVHVTISAVGVALADVVDVEVGCVWPVEKAVPWVLRARAAGIDPTVYCNWQNDLHRVRAAFDVAGVAQPHYWVAKYDGRPEVPAGTVGKQYAAPESGAPGHYDISSVADFWPGVDDRGEEDMAPITEADANTFWMAWLRNAQNVDGQEETARAVEWITESADRLARVERRQITQDSVIQAIATAVNSGTSIDEDRLNATVDTATRESTERSVRESVLPLVRSVLGELYSDDNVELSEDVARLVVEKVAARLGAAAVVGPPSD
jgi:hypothetical protein